jgi:CheY-like chemotaxis protein
MPKEKLNILLVDDDRDEYLIFKEALEKLHIHFQLFYAEDCLKDAHDLLHANQIHLVFLDINLPAKSGIKFLKEIKASPQYQHIAVIMYTVSVYEKDIDECFSSGAHFYLVKPYAEVNLVESLKKIFSSDWSQPQHQPSIDEFIINLAFA